jgi:uncharacterized membrane protein
VVVIFGVLGILGSMGNLGQEGALTGFVFVLVITIGYALTAWAYATAGAYFARR